MTLRALEPNDIDLLYQVENDPSLRSVSSANVPYSRQLLSDYILNSTGDIYTDKQLRLIAETDDGHTPVGILDLSNFNPQHLRAEIGITILPDYRQKGYATQALRLLIDYARTTLHLHQVYAVVPSGHEVSRHLFLSLGFTATAILTDWLRLDDGSYDDALIYQLIII